MNCFILILKLLGRWNTVPNPKFPTFPWHVQARRGGVIGSGAEYSLIHLVEYWEN